MVRPHLHVDWPDAVAKAAAAKGEWVLVGSDVSANTLNTVYRRENQALRAAGRMEARMLEVYGTPPRGDLWLRSVTDWKPQRVVGDSVVKKLRMPRSLHIQVRRYAQSERVSVSSLVDAALTRIARNGRRYKSPEKTTVAMNVSTKKWQRAAARAEADGFKLSAALRDELLWTARRRR